MEFLVFLFLQGSPLKAETTVLTQTVGTSAFQVVTSREVKALDYIGRALEKEVKGSSIELSQDAANEALFEIAIYREAQSLAAIKTAPGEIANLVATVKGRLIKNPDWKKLEVTDEELKVFVERKKVAMEYLKLKASALTTIITDQEVQDYFEKNRVKFGSTPFESQQNNIRIYLQKESQKQRVQEWMSALKTKYQIKNDVAEIMNAAQITQEKAKTQNETTPSEKK